MQDSIKSQKNATCEGGEETSKCLRILHKTKITIL
jgi:hypothetical protein